MSITDIKPEDCPAELCARIEKVMKRENLDWKGALVFLARKVVSPK